jgi:hypothetical protein
VKEFFFPSLSPNIIVFVNHFPMTFFLRSLIKGSLAFTRPLFT